MKSGDWPLNFMIDKLVCVVRLNSVMSWLSFTKQNTTLKK